MSALALTLQIPPLALLATWALLALNGAAANWIDYEAVLSGRRRSLFWGTIFNALRVFALISVILGVRIAAPAAMPSLMVVGLVGYFIFLLAQVSYLHVQSMKAPQTL